MHQNLLPKEEKQILKVGYRRRLWIVSCFCIFFVSLLAIVLLLPSFIMAFYRALGIAERREIIVRASEKQVDILSFSKIINAKVETVLSLKKSDSSDSMVDHIDLLYKAAPSSVRLTSITHKPDSGGIKLDGVAENRETLLSFQKSVKSLRFVSDAELPVNSFARDVDLPFSMEISLK